MKVQRLPINSQGQADVFWWDIENNTNQVERKQWGEVLGGMDHVESQLRGEIQSADKTYLLIEGVILPTALGCDAYVKMKESPLFKVQHSYGSIQYPQPGMYAKVQAWLNRLDASGITVIHTTDLVSTAMALIAVYNNSQKTEHTTLNRYSKPKVAIKTLDPNITSLMGIQGGGLGEVKAKQMVEVYKTFWQTLIQPTSQWEVLIGKSSASKLEKAIGRSISYGKPKS